VNRYPLEKCLKCGRIARWMAEERHPELGWIVKWSCARCGECQEAKK
jgi:hypothetical protein